MRLFAYDSSLFTGVEGIEQTHEKLIKNFQTVNIIAQQWKMIFNPDVTKRAIEPLHPDLTLNGVPVARRDHTKYLEVYKIVA